MGRINRKLVLIVAGYVAFFGFCFVTSAYYTFPYERVRDLLVRRVSALPPAAGELPPKLSIEDLGPYGLSGIALEGVRYERKPATGKEPGVKLELDELKVSASLLGLLRDRADVDFELVAGDGEASGTYETAEGEPTRLQAELDEVDFARMGLGSYLGLPIKGKASGTIDVTIADKPAGTQGEIDLKIEGLELGDGKSKVKVPGMAGGLTLDTLRAGELELKVAVRDGIASVEKLESKGKDVQLTGSGSVRLVKAVGESRADLALGVKIDDGYKNKSERTKAAFELMGASPLLKRAITPDGTIRFRLTGPISAMRAVPGAGGGGARPRKDKEGQPQPFFKP